MKFILLTVISFMGLISLHAQEPHKNKNLSFEERAKYLVSKMTNEEKVSLMRHESSAIDRLEIPKYNWWNECLHGVGRSGAATVFPQAIGMAAMWNKDMMERVGTVISDEARAKYNHYSAQGKREIYNGLTFWTPNINIFRDPRWGRGMETYGEDPYLTGELAVPFIKALQGDDPKYLKVAATVKHFVVHSGPEYNRHSFNARPGQRDFIETYTPHFKKAIEKTNVETVMCAYNRLDGKPCCGDVFIDSLLRQAWGFKGHIVSDCWALTDIYKKEYHNYLPTPAEAAAYAIKGGTDLNCGTTFKYLLEALEKGLITEEDIDRAVTRLMVTRLKLGLFANDKDVKYSSIPYSVVESKPHINLALESARRSIVLMKNDNNRLPIDKNVVKRVAVVGPNADEDLVLYGNYNGYSTAPKTLLKGLRERYPNIEFVYTPAVSLADELSYINVVNENNIFTDESLSTKGLSGEYFATIDFKGEVIRKQIDKTLDFRWFENSPLGGNNDYSVRWNGYLVPDKSGKHRIGLDGFNGKLYIDGKQIASINSYDTHGVSTPEIELEKGKKYKITVETSHAKGNYAMLKVVWSEPAADMMQKAIENVKNSDFVIYAMGLSPQLEGEEMGVHVKGYKGGDREDMGLPASQRRAMEELEKIGKPSALVLFNGSAVAIPWEKENMKAIVEAWYPGGEGGVAIAEILFGDYNPSGRLPVTFYSSEKELPDFQDYNMDGRTYRYYKGEPLFSFGHGLSYTTYDYNNMKLPKIIKPTETIEVSCTVKNNGKMAGEEVVQLYVSHKNCKYPVAVRSLKGFDVVSLKPMESKEVKFTLTPEDLSVLDENNKPIVPEGIIEISIGGGQPIKGLKNFTTKETSVSL